MSVIVSVKDCLYNEGERYDLNVNCELEPIDYMGKVKFKNVEINGYYFSIGDRVRFMGKINVTCVFECDRCLKEFEKEFSFNFNETFSNENDDETLLITRNQTVDLQPLVYDTILTSLPIERLCKEDCKGLCHKCGIDKNFSSCSCSDSDDDNPFAVLRGLVD